jgi:hypothetical protein
MGPVLEGSGAMRAFDERKRTPVKRLPHMESALDLEQPSRMTSAYFRLISWHFNSRYSQASGDMYDG